MSQGASREVTGPVLTEEEWPQGPLRAWAFRGLHTPPLTWCLCRLRPSGLLPPGLSCGGRGLWC